MSFNAKIIKIKRITGFPRCHRIRQNVVFLKPTDRSICRENIHCSYLIIMKLIESLHVISSNSFEKESCDKREIMSSISSLVRIWKIRRCVPGCDFVSFLRAVYFLAKPSHLYNKYNYNCEFPMN